jgi:hypothetical protein
MTTPDAIMELVGVVLLLILAGIPTVLTAAMFISRNSMLGWPCGGFWLIFGGYNYQISTVKTVTDIHYVLFFFSCLAMVIFCGLGAYGLREVKDIDAETDEESEPQDPEQYPDEAPEGTYVTDDMGSSYKPSQRAQGVRRRAVARKTVGGSSWSKH